MRNAMVYPYHFDFTGVVRYASLIPNLAIKRLVSPSGWGMKGQDAAYADMGETTNLIVEADFFTALRETDTVIFIHGCHNLDFETDIYPKMIHSIENKKDIISYLPLTKEQQTFLKKLAAIQHTKFISFDTADETELLSESNHQFSTLDTPLIMLCGTDEKANIFDPELKFRKAFQEDGYSVSQIGSKPYSNLFGFHPFPEFMYRTNLSESDKIYAFQRYLKRIEEEEHPDLILLGLQDGIEPLTNQFNNNFCIIPTEVFRAVQPDYVILSLLYNNYQPEHFPLMQDSFFHKYGFYVDSFHLKNVRFDFSRSEQHDTKIYSFVLPEQVNTLVQNIKNDDIKLYNLSNQNEFELVKDDILTTLSDNASINVF